MIGYYFTVSNAVLDPYVIKNLGRAVYLLFWFYKRSTASYRGISVVLGGKPVSYSQIALELGFSIKTIGRWVKILVEGGYIYAISIFGGTQQFAVIGYVKFNIAPKKPHVIPLALRVIQKIDEEGRLIRLSGKKGMNPALRFFFREMKWRGISRDKTELNGEDEASTGVSQEIPTSTDKNVPTSKDTKVDIISDEIEIRNKDIDTVSDDVQMVFQAYMTAKGSKKGNPDGNVVALIEEAIETECVEALEESIRNYSKVVATTERWRFVESRKFFARNFYSKYLVSAAERDDYSEDDYVPRNPGH